MKYVWNYCNRDKKKRQVLYNTVVSKRNKKLLFWLLEMHIFCVCVFAHACVLVYVF